jgi:2-amino-4-hydroxy-6-hydroxymethyldihydropteridine diphosphokinase
MEYLNKTYLLTGGNVGNKLFNLEQALMWIQQQCGNIVSRSAIYETAPWGNTQQPSFLNQALELHTGYGALHLMWQLLQIEEKMGRIRQEKYGPRIIDIDILLFNEEVLDSPELTIPHKELHNRRFVLKPLSEIAPLLVHPILKKSIQQLLAECKDSSKVEKLHTAPDD